MAVITPRTLVVDAWRSGPAAPGIFRRHGVDPGADCAVVRDTTALEDAEEWCGLRDLDGLIAELNAAHEGAEGRDSPS
jgi:hypothetical protein